MRSRIDVVGGVYREQCRLPTPTDEIWGSGGRAAAVIAGLGIPVTLHTAVTGTTEVVLASLAHTFHFDVATVSANETLRFQYEHALSTPVIYPQRVEHLTIQFDAENVLAFGMLEATAIVRAKRVVYDPQNPIAPEPIEFPPDVTPRIAYVLNSWEARKLGGVDDLAEAASRIMNQFRTAVVVIKRGPRGAVVYENERSERIPTYKTDTVWPIGSGDVFAAAFAARWAVEGRPAVEAAGDASRAAARYVNSRVLPIYSDEIKERGQFNFPPLLMQERAAEDKGYDVYLAGPFFNIASRLASRAPARAIEATGTDSFPSERSRWKNRSLDCWW
jgi:hypothetical protein